MDCLGTYCTHVQTCDVTRVQSATEWTAWVHTAHMSKPVMSNHPKCGCLGCIEILLHSYMMNILNHDMDPGRIPTKQAV